MQVQLTIADENCKGQIITVNAPSFLIGRAKDCHLRSNQSRVSRHHCIIRLEENAAMIQNLSEGNGTFVNGKRLASEYVLQDGDELSIGDHLFTVRILEDVKQAPPKIKSFFELPSSSVIPPKKTDSSKTEISAVPSPPHPSESAKPSKDSESAEEDPIMFEIRLDGQRLSVTKERLFSLAQSGAVMPDDLITVAGTKIFADSIQGIVFSDSSSGFFSASPSVSPPYSSPQHHSRHAPSHTAPSHTASRHPSARRPSKHDSDANTKQASPGQQKDARHDVPSNSTLSSPAPISSSAPAAAPTAAAPFDFSDFGEITGEAALFQSAAGEPVVRVARMENTFSVLWHALDITFSRAYIMDGNRLVVHGIKAFYYIAAVACMLGVFLFWLNVAIKCHSAENALQEFSASVFPLTVVTIGCLMIMVIVRVLFEMLLLTWIESAKQEEPSSKK